MPSRWWPLDRKLLSVCTYSSVGAPSSCYDAKDTVVVRVQDSSNIKDYIIIRKLLAWHSSYFAAAIDALGYTAMNNLKVLDIECSHAVFDISYCWIYTGRLKDTPVTEPPASLAVKAYFPTIKAFYDTWIFADRCDIPMLGNTVIDTLHECPAGSNGLPVNMEYLYANTEPDSRLRNFVLAWFELTTDFSDLAAYSSRIKPTVAFLSDVYPLMGARPWAERPEDLDDVMLTSVDRCRWHDHSGPVGRLQIKREPTE